MWGVGKTPGGNAAIVGVAHADDLAGADRYVPDPWLKAR
jgi:hypothetical protein